MPAEKDVWTGRFIGSVVEVPGGIHFMVELDQDPGRTVMIKVPTQRIDALIKGAQREQAKIQARKLGDTEDAKEKFGNP